MSGMALRGVGGKSFLGYRTAWILVNIRIPGFPALVKPLKIIYYTTPRSIHEICKYKG